MKGFRLLTLLLTGLSTAAAADRLPLGAGAPMADVQMVGVDGRKASIAGVRGQHGTLVIFSCNHCPWAKAWEGRIADIGNAYAKQGIGVIVINANDPERVPEDDLEAMKARAKQRGFEFPYVVDATSDVARAFGATKTPEVFLFNAEGRLVYYGAVDDDAQNPQQVEAHYLRDALDAVLAGKPVRMAETKAIGCSIKFRPSS
jgi:peroxiredoxin